MSTAARDKRLLHIGMAIRDLREMNHLTQEDVADMVGISPSTHCRYETATRILPVNLLLNYSKTFGVPINRLLPLEYVETIQRELPEEYYELSTENQRIVQATMNVLIKNLLLQQDK